jgi:hypothetical protein
MSSSVPVVGLGVKYSGTESVQQLVGRFMSLINQLFKISSASVQQTVTLHGIRTGFNQLGN